MRLIGITAFILEISFATVVRAERVVASGGMIKIASFWSVDQVCHSKGLPAVSILARPYGGVLVVKGARDYPNFPTLDTRARCNTARVPLTQVLYQSTPGFHGTDQAIFEVIFPKTGLIRRWNVPISVR